MTSHEYETILAELRALRKRQNALLFFVCLIVMWMAGLTLAGDVQIALADRQQFPQAEWPYLYYFGLEHLPTEQRDEAAKVLAFAICSLNDEVVLEQQLPVEVSGIYRVDTRGLGWETTLPGLLAEHYPYSRAQGSLPIVVRADWFVQFAMDQEANPGVNAYQLLLFGKKLSNLKEFFSILKADVGSTFEHGHIEDRSAVSVNRVRLINTVPTSTRQDVWLTFDIDRLTGEKDPLEHLDRSFKHDASEIIGSLPKSVASTGESGLLQVYALANGAGTLQNKAPANIVVDSTGVRGVEIRAAVSCVSCHVEGLRPLKINALRQYIMSGAEAYADYKQRQDIERFHLTNVQKLISRHNDDYATIIFAINGFTTQQNAEAFQRLIKNYDAPVTLEAAAREFNMDVKEFQLALGYGGNMPARIAQLAQGIPIARSSWEPDYRFVSQAVASWRVSTK